MIKFTQTAADKVLELIQDENNPNLCLRIYVTGGGCSGFQYGFSFDDQIADDDTIVIQDCSTTAQVKLLVDAMSLAYLEGAEVDFSTGIQEEFIIRNPNAKTTCGCGSSFSIDED